MRRIQGTHWPTLLTIIFILQPSLGHAVEITTFVGGDPGEGVDFKGNFLYAVNMFGPGGQEIRDAEFTDDLDTDGFEVESSNMLPNWADPDYGDSDADDALEEIMQSIRWSNVPDDNPPTVNIEMAVTSGESYKLQMFFTESCCDRAFDIFLDEELLVDDFAIYEYHEDEFWSNSAREDGVLISHEFTAASDFVTLELGMDAPDSPDNNGQISAITLETLAQATLGDFNGDGVLDGKDIDDLTQRSASGTHPPKYDLTGDSLVNADDVAEWIGPNVYNSWLGDANLDNEFTSSDLVAMLASGTYESGVAAVWTTGDFNGDGLTTTSDLVVALSDGGYENGPRAATAAAVPEPATFVLFLSGLIAWSYLRRRLLND